MSVRSRLDAEIKIGGIMKIWKMTTGEWIDTTELIKRNVEYYKWKRANKKRLIKEASDAEIAKNRELRLNTIPDWKDETTRSYKEEYKGVKNKARKRAYFD